MGPVTVYDPERTTILFAQLPVSVVVSQIMGMELAWNVLVSSPLVSIALEQGVCVFARVCREVSTHQTHIWLQELGLQSHF